VQHIADMRFKVWNRHTNIPARGALKYAHARRSVYEVDQAAVLRVNETLVASTGLVPLCKHVTVGLCNEDWCTALVATGFVALKSSS
jgi:hypothetical protein